MSSRAASGLEEGWTSHVDSASGKTYFFNAAKNETIWTSLEPPPTLPTPPRTAVCRALKRCVK